MNTPMNTFVALALTSTGLLIFYATYIMTSVFKLKAPVYHVYMGTPAHSSYLDESDIEEEVVDEDEGEVDEDEVDEDEGEVDEDEVDEDEEVDGHITTSDLEHLFFRDTDDEPDHKRCRIA